MASLYHYGVKGMKWGVRKRRHADSKAVEKIRNTEKRRGIKSLSNQEIQTATRRMQSERKYAEVAKKPKREWSDTEKEFFRGAVKVGAVVVGGLFAKGVADTMANGGNYAYQVVPGTVLGSSPVRKAIGR